MKPLYDEYMDDCDECSLAWCLKNAPRPLHCTTKDRAAAKRALSRYERACLGFEAAVMKFPNLKHVNADFGAPFKRIQRWRAYQLEPAKFESHGNHASDDAYFAARAFLLRALGLRSSLSDSLTSLNLDITEELWAVGELDRFWRENDNFNASNGHVDESLIKQQVNLMEDSFIHLTDLRIGVLERGFPTPYRDFVLPSFLRRATKLQRLDLSLPTTWLLAEGGTEDILGRIVGGLRWPELREVTLQVAFAFGSFLDFISAHAETITSLTLYRCDMFGGTWPNMYRAMHDIHFRSLRRLNFRQCADQDPDVPPLAAFSHNNTVVSHHSLFEMKELWMGYSEEIYSYILGKMNLMPPLFRCGGYESEQSEDDVVIAL